MSSSDSGFQSSGGGMFEKSSWKYAAATGTGIRCCLTMAREFVSHKFSFSPWLESISNSLTSTGVRGEKKPRRESL
jgi:hypothetical protein